MSKKTRKEVQLDPSVIALLKVGAERKEWSLKRYMEHVLFKEAKKWIPYASDETMKRIPVKK